MKTLVGHTGSVTSVAFSPGGNQVASESLDNLIVILGTKDEDLGVLRTLQERTCAVNHVAFSPNVGFVASADLEAFLMAHDAEGAVQPRSAQVQPATLAPCWPAGMLTAQSAIGIWSELTSLWSSHQGTLVPDKAKRQRCSIVRSRLRMVEAWRRCWRVLCSLWMEV